MFFKSLETICSLNQIRDYYTRLFDFIQSIKLNGLLDQQVVMSAYDEAEVTSADQIQFEDTMACTDFDSNEFDARTFNE